MALYLSVAALRGNFLFVYQGCPVGKKTFKLNFTLYPYLLSGNIVCILERSLFCYLCRFMQARRIRRLVA